MPLPAVACHVKSSLFQPNQPGLTSPEILPPKPKKRLLKKRPSVTVRSRPTSLKSTCPQGCAQYEAKAMSGATFLVGLRPNGVPAFTGPYTLLTNPNEVVWAGGMAFVPVPLVAVSWNIGPTGVMISVSGVSIDADQALPHGPATV